MKTRCRISIAVCALLAMIAMTGLAQAQWLNNNEVAFTGTVTSVSVNGEGVGTLFVRMNTVDVRVVINSKTALRDAENDEITMAQLAEMYAAKPEGNYIFLEVIGKFSTSGVLATRVSMLNSADPNTYSLRGTIGQIVPSGEDLKLSLLGMQILVPSGTPILIDGLSGSASDLGVGTKIEAEGVIDADSGDWTAATIKILTENKRRGSVVFEGLVDSYDPPSGILQVAVNGVEGSVFAVYIAQATRLVGELAEGVAVHVSGILETDMTVSAKEIIVVPMLQIKPDELKLAVGQTVQLTVELREIATADLPITLSSDNEGVAAVSSAMATILAGAKTATFNVSAVAFGTAIITATDGTNTATAEVIVGELSGDEIDPPVAEVRLAFAPDHVKLKLNEIREVVLLIKPPQKAPVEVAFQIISDVADLFSVDASRILSNGAANMKVMLEAASVAGSGTLIATLPAELGGGTAELVVEIGKSNGKK
jgi:hypothetical protein